MKKLCFGFFATVLNLCKAQGVSQKQLCGTILLAIAPNYDIRSDDTAVANLLHCDRNLSPNVTDPAPTANVRDVAEYFKQKVLPLLDDNKRKLIILAMKDIIASDETIDAQTPVEKVKGITKASLVSQTEFVLSDFLAGIFLYTVINVKNTDGKASIKEIMAEYIASFESHKDEVNILSIAIYYSMENADVLAPDPHLMALLTETGGKCHKCGRPLCLVKEGQPVYYGSVVRLSKEAESDVVFCVDCERETRNATEEQKGELLASKREMAKIVTALDDISTITFESKIEAVLRAVSDMPEPGITALKLDPVKIDRKITQYVLRERVRSPIIKLYYPVQDILDRLAGENKLNTDKFAKSIKRMYEDASETLESQSDIFNLLVTSLHEKTGRKHIDACEIIISYFVGRCEVFDEIAE